MPAEALKCDACIIGAGIAGFAAAAALKKRGKHVVVVAKSGGASSVSSGAWDIGAAETYRSVLVDRDGFGAATELGESLAAVAEALAPDLAVTVSLEPPLCLPTSTGRWKRTHAAQTVQAAADLTTLSGKKIALVTSRQWRFPSEALAERWQTEAALAGHALEITPVAIELRGNDWPIPQIATHLAYNQRFGELFTQIVTTALGGKSFDALLFPPLFLDTAFAARLGEQLKLPVTEILSAAEPVAGKRLSGAIEKALARLDVPLLRAPSGALTPTLYHQRVTGLRSPTHDVRARHYVLATGKLFGGGVRWEKGRLDEPIFGTPLFHSREERATAEVESWATVGAWVDATFRPVDELGEPHLENLSAVGSLLGGVDFAAARLGAGFMAYTGDRCGRSLE